MESEFVDTKLTGHLDYEGIMIELAAERGWEFKFGDEVIPVQSVFNHATYLPALLTLASAELDARHIGCDLAFRLEGEANSLFGASLSFVDARNSTLAQIWRIAASAMAVESLPRHGSYIDLEPLQYVLGDQYAAFVTPDAETVSKEAE